jgi:hypothetical protein
MAYNVTLLDRRGESATVQVAPDRPPRVVRPAIATNHQGEVEWAEHGRFTATKEREHCLRTHHEDPQTEASDLIGAFLRPPLYNTDYGNGFGTLYTAVYRPEAGLAQWRWPGAVWEQSFADFREGRREVHYSPAGARMSETAPARATAVRRRREQAAGWGAAKPAHHVEPVLPALAAVRAGLAAAGCTLSPPLAAWLREAERSGRIPWETLGVACAQQYCGR